MGPATRHHQAPFNVPLVSCSCFWLSNAQHTARRPRHRIALSSTCVIRFPVASTSHPRQYHPEERPYHSATHNLYGAIETSLQTHAHPVRTEEQVENQFRRHTFITASLPDDIYCLRRLVYPSLTEHHR